MSAKYRHVFFDVDSTLVTVEGIDILGGGNPEIAKLTEAAMNGLVPLDQVYARRLAMIRPTRDAVDALAQRYLDSIVDGAEETIAALRDAGAVVHFVTAGIDQAVRPLAEKLGVRDVHAVRLEFDGDGGYRDFDRRSPLTRPHGKELVVRDIRARTKGSAAFVGDAVSDLEAATAVDLFIGFGGVVTREVVRAKAEVYVTSLRDVLPYLIE